MTIVSSDKDLMQLVQSGVSMLDTMKNKTIGPDEVREKFGVPPDKVVDVQALAGDSTDNVPGVPGIGVKTAAELINEYGDLESLLARAGEIKQPKRRERLTEFAMQARLSLDLVTLKDDVPREVPVEALGVRDPEPDALLGFLRVMEFSTLTKRIAEGLGAEPPPPAERPAISSVPEADARPGSKPAAADAPGAGPAAAVVAALKVASEAIDRSKYETVTELPHLEAWIAAARAAGRFAFDTETTSLDPMQAEFVGFSMAVAPGKACYVPLAHRAGSGSFDFGDANPRQVPVSEALAVLKPLLEDPSVLKIGQNLKFDCLVLHRHGIDLAPLDDTMLLSYALDAGRGQHGMDTLSERVLKHTCMPFTQVLEHAPGAKKSDKTFAQVPLEKATEYAGEDADVTLRLWMTLKPRLAAEHMTSVYETLERPLVCVLADMERTGVKVDRSILSRLTSTFAQRVARLETEIYDLAGHKFNLGSPKQLGEFLFDNLKLPGGRKTKTGQWETRAGLLDDLAASEELPEQHRKLINVMLEWRQLTKLMSTYTESLPQHINPETGRIHTSYALASTTTGRLASTDPNLQNIPIRTKEGREIRTAFIAEPGHKLISADYSQIELRVLAHIADIPQLRKAFAEGLDIHAMTASEMFGGAHQGHALRCAPAGKGDQLRHHLWNLGLWSGGAAGDHQAGGRRIHRHLFQALPRHSRLYGNNQEAGARARIRGNHLRPAHPLPGDQHQESLHARVPGTRLDQRAHSGLGRRHHPARHDPHAGRTTGRTAEFGAHASAGARRTGLRGQGRRRRQGFADHKARDGNGRRAGHPARRTGACGCQGRRQLGSGALNQALLEKSCKIQNGPECFPTRFLICNAAAQAHAATATL